LHSFPAFKTRFAHDGGFVFIDWIFSKTVRPRFFGFALTAVFLLVASVVHAQSVTADFSWRNGATATVPSGLFSVGGIGSRLNDSNAINTLTTAGINETRYWINLDQIYSSSTPDFWYLDRDLRLMQNTGVHPLGVINGTPTSLGGWNPCSPPSDNWRWGQMAASVVAHVNQTFPGLMRDYEIWNEPELPTSLCVSDDTARLNTYLAMFASAGSAMHAQAQKDGRPIRIGGPDISRVKALASVWIPALLNNSSSAPYVDFVSFHLYLTGDTDIWNGMDWSRLYAVTQSTTGGMAYYYKLIEPLVRAGHQPNAWSTPIYISEFNDNWAFAVDCCRNDPTYGPLWNSLVITDLLNVVYSGAKNVPSQLSYFNASGNYFCLLGQWNWAMDCNPSSLDPYPQFYAYKLFASSQYLDLQRGGHMAAWVSPASTTSGLSATAFYTTSADSVVVVNPGSTWYNTVTVFLKNPGLTSTSGTVYTLNSSNGQISSQWVALTPVTGGYTAKVVVPSYSTVALSVKGGSGTPTSGTAPKAVLTMTPQSGSFGVVMTADATQSTGGGSSIVARTIDFGDGSYMSWWPTVAHKYATRGTFNVTLTIKNQSGQTSTASQVVTVW
jgi:hypothetical protein